MCLYRLYLAENADIPSFILYIFIKCVYKRSPMETLAKELPFMDLPSTMWGVHIHPQYEFIGIFHISISESKLVIDKGIVLIEEKYQFRAKIFLNGLLTDIPNVILNIANISELSTLIYLLHDKNVCRNFSEREEYPDCFKLIDELRDNSLYCSMCQEEYTLRELTKDVLESHNYETDDVNISYPHENLSSSLVCQPAENVALCTICNEYIPETGMINHKEHCMNELEEKCKENESRILERAKTKQALCNICGKMFSNGYRIEEHMLTHTQEKPFRCKICFKSFSKNFNLKMHEHTHSGERPYICSSCGKSYTTSSNLRTHTLSSHSNEKRHVCDICKMTFVYPRYLKLHMRKHTGERPFVCDTCGKKFSKNIHLTIHMRTHTGEKPHRCGMCSSGFATTGGLAYHKRVHHKDINL